jgi:hypothetical protein
MHGGEVMAHWPEERLQKLSDKVKNSITEIVTIIQDEVKHDGKGLVSEVLYASLAVMDIFEYILIAQIIHNIHYSREQNVFSKEEADKMIEEISSVMKIKRLSSVEKIDKYIKHENEVYEQER